MFRRRPRRERAITTPCARPRVLGAMCAALLALHGPASASAAPKPVVLVPHGSGGTRCAAETTLAGEIALAAGIELVRTAVDETETLDDARRRAHADVAIGGTRQRRVDGSVVWTLELSAEGRPSLTREGPDAGAILRALWPHELPPLPRRAVPAAAQPTALDALCAGDAPRAYALSGAAIGPALWGETAPPDATKEDPRLGVEVARALAVARAGRNADALARARRAATRLGARESWPLWRTSEGSGPASVVISGDVALVLRAGALESYELNTGAPLGRAIVGRIAPPVTPIGGGRVLAAGPAAVTAIDAATGAIAWTAEIHAPWPEVVVADDRVLVAGPREIVALSASSGEALWRTDMRTEPSAGPVRVGDRVVVPAETELVILDLARGSIVARADVGDELVGPLVAQGRDVWCAIGADGVGRLDVAALVPSGGAPESARLQRLARGAFGASWPAALIDRGAVVATADARRGPQLMRVEGDGEAPPVVVARGLVGPARALGGPRVLALEKKRDVVVALDGDGKTVWRHPLGAPARAVVVELGAVWVTAGSKVWMLDAITGRVERMIEVGEQVSALAVSARGAVAIGEGGTAWGLPSIEDPRTYPLLRELRRTEARAALALGRSAEAQVALEAARALDPEGVEGLLALARLAERSSPAAAPRAWLRVLEGARPTDPAAVEARARLAATIGLVARVPLRGAVRAMVLADDRALVEVDGEILAIDGDGRVVWRRPGRDLAKSGASITVGGASIRASDGVPDPGATSSSTVPVAAVVVSASGAVTVANPARRGAPRSIELGAAGPAVGGARRAWIAREATVLVVEVPAPAK